MLFLFLYFRNPIILVPGIFRSKLDIEVNGMTSIDSKLGCPSNLKRDHFWVNFKYLLPSKLKCILNWITLETDNDTDFPKTKPNVTVTPQDFGGLSGIENTAKILMFNFPYMRRLIKLLKNAGYEERENLFGAPYDWRYGIAQSDEYWNNFTQLIETAYHKNNLPVKLFSHSCGGLILYYFLTNKTTQEWRQKYIHSVIMSAPSFSGSGFALQALWLNRIPYFPFKNNDIVEFIKSLGALHVHIPNAMIYQNDTIIRVGNINYTGKNILELLQKYQKISPNSKLNIPITQEYPIPLDVPTKILYNSGYPTSIGLSTNQINSDKYTNIIVSGDSLVGSAGIDWVCENWPKKGTQIECIDMKEKKFKYTHMMLLNTKNVLQIYYKWLVEDTPKYNNSNNEL